MGLDITHNCWHGPYSLFGNWRRWLMHHALGQELLSFKGYELDASPVFALVPLDADEHTRQEIMQIEWKNRKRGEKERHVALVGDAPPRSWDELGDDPLVILFAHSDCDGEIAAGDCAPLADRMEQVLNLLPKKLEHDAFFYTCTLQFIEGLRLAASLNEDVLFL